MRASPPKIYTDKLYLHLLKIPKHVHNLELIKHISHYGTNVNRIIGIFKNNCQVFIILWTK